MSEDKEYFCSFCGKSSYDAKHFVMQGDVAICDMCVGACAAIMAEQDRKDAEDDVPSGLLTPQEIKARLSKKMDSYVEMRSEGDISRELFRSKCAELEPRIKKLQEEIDKLTTANKPKEVVDYREKLTVLQYALEQCTYPDTAKMCPSR